MHSSVREANFQALLSDDSEVRSHVGNLVEVYEDIRAEDVRGTRLAHMVDAVRLTQQEPNLVYDGKHLHESRLPHSILTPFVTFLKRKQQATGEATGLCGPATNPEVKFLDKFSLRGVQYSTMSCRRRNSHILFRRFQSDTSRAPSQPEPGQIIHIFLHSLAPTHHARLYDSSPLHPVLYVCVQPYHSLRPELSDLDQMYRRFDFAGGFLCRRELAPLVVIEPSSIISHAAVTPLLIKEHEVLHILPMDRVCFFLVPQNRETEKFENSSCRSPFCGWRPKVFR